MESNLIKILGINFFNGPVIEVVQAIKSGGLLVVPSGPGLASIKNDPTYYKSLQLADIVIADSGFMALLWNASHKAKVKRISGLEFLINCFSDMDLKHNGEMLLVNPNHYEAKANNLYLQKNGFNVTGSNSYIAPMYKKDKIEDKILLQMIEKRRPKYVIINLGGGVQEILGAYLKNNLSYKPAIICTGAAIAFLSGEQAHIPNWADKLFIGWLFRCIEKPKLYIPRYFSALKLIMVMMQFENKKDGSQLTKLTLPKNTKEHANVEVEYLPNV